MARPSTREVTPPTVMVVVDGHPTVIGGRVAKIAQFLVANAGQVNRGDLQELAFRCNEAAHPGSVDPFWSFRGARMP